MNLTKRISAFLLTLILSLSVFQTTVFAASGSVSLSGASGKVGSTVTVSGTAKSGSGAIGSAQAVITYDPSALEYVSGTGGVSGGSGSVNYAGYTSDGSSKSLSFSITFKIKKSGSHKVSVSSAYIWNFDEQQLSVSKGSATVTGKSSSSSSSSGSSGSSSGSSNSSGSSSGSSSSGSSNSSSSSDDSTEETTNPKDNNSKLSSLTVSSGTLSPEFNADTKEYSIEVAKDVTDIEITAKAESDKAKVEVTGGTDLKLGENTAKVVVTAEDGSTTEYVIKIQCGEIEKISINDLVYTIDESFKDEQIPNGFKRTQIVYNEREYQGVKRDVDNMQLMYLSTDGKSQFFIIDANTNEFYPFISVILSDEASIILQPAKGFEEETKDLEKTTITYNDQTVEAWKYSDDFYLICAKTDGGTTKLYLFDSVEKTFQRYVAPQEEGLSIFGIDLYGNNLYLISAMAGVIIILLVAVITVAVKSKKKNTRQYV